MGAAGQDQTTSAALGFIPIPLPAKRDSMAALLGDEMQYLRDLLHDIRMAYRHFRWVRENLRGGGNPDEAF